MTNQHPDVTLSQVGHQRTNKDDTHNAIQQDQQKQEEEEQKEEQSSSLAAASSSSSSSASSSSPSSPFSKSEQKCMNTTNFSQINRPLRFEFRYKEDIRTVVFTSSYFLLFLYLWNTYTCIWHIHEWFLWCMLCLLSFIGAVAVHNHMHCNTFVNEYDNDIFKCVLSLVYGHPVSSYVPGHNLSHHQHTQLKKDVMRTTKLQYKWHFLNGLLFAFIIGFQMIKNDSTYFQSQESVKPPRPIVLQLKREKIILYSITLILIYLDIWKWVWIALLPHIYAKFCIISLNMLQHDGCDMGNKYNSARNFTGEVVNFLCYNNGFHTVHHMNPRAHWSLLRDMHIKLVAPYRHPNLDQENILLYIWKTFVFPGIRINYKGERLILNPDDMSGDEPWFYKTEDVN